MAGIEFSDLDRITLEPGKLGGKACIRGIRISATLILDMLAGGMSETEIIREYDFLELEDIREALRYGARCAEERMISQNGEIYYRSAKDILKRLE